MRPEFRLHRLSMTIFACLSLIIAAASPAFGNLFDLSTGGYAGLQLWCSSSSPMNGLWTEENASFYATPKTGPLTGLVLKSERGTQSCLTTLNYISVQRNYTFQMSVFMPAAQNTGRKIVVTLVDECDERTELAIVEGTFQTAGWNLISAEVTQTMTFPKNYKIEILVTTDIEFVVLRWFEISNKPTKNERTVSRIEPYIYELNIRQGTTTEEPTTTDEPTTTEEPSTTDEPTTTEEPTTTMEPTTTDNPTTTEDPTTTDEQTTTEKPTTTEETTTTDNPTTTAEPTTTDNPTTAEPSTTTEDPTTTVAPTTTEEPNTEPTSTTFTPPPSTGNGQSFPDTWSVLFGISFGMLIMCLVFFSMLLCRWVYMRKKKINRANEEPYMAPLPRLEVISERNNFRPGRITGSGSPWLNAPSQNWRR